MAKRGRTSLAELEFLKTSPVVAIERLAPPAHLSGADRATWIDVIDCHEAGAFNAAHAPLLEQYTRHVATARLLADEILHFDRAWLSVEGGLARFDRLLAMHERETRAASSLATRLRITRQSVDEKRAAGHIKRGTRRPWTNDAI